MLRLKGGAGKEDSSCSDEDEYGDEPPQKKICMLATTYLDADSSDELLRTPTLPAQQGVKVKRRSNSCDGRLQGNIFFHSTPLRPGPGLHVTFKDDMHLIDKMVDIKKKKNKNKGRQTMTIPDERTDIISKKDSCMTDYHQTVSGNKHVRPGQEKLDDDHDQGEDITVVGTNDGVRAGDDRVEHDDVSVQNEPVVQVGDTSVSVSNAHDEIHEDEVMDGDDKVRHSDEDVPKNVGGGGVKDGNVNVTSDDDKAHGDVRTVGESGDHFDPYDFNDGDDFGLDDSMEDPTFELPKEKRKRFDTVEIWREIGASKSSKKVAPLSTEVRKKTPPSEFKKRRDAADETHWRQLGGSTPDDKEKKKRPGLNLKLLEFLVHKEAKAKGIDLAITPLKPGFFDELVRLYGNVEGGNRLTPWTGTSGPYIMKKWRLIFCTKTTSKHGTKLGGVHIYEPPQVDQTPCNLCNLQATPDMRDTLLDHLMKAPSVENSAASSNSDEFVKCPYCEKGFKSPKTLKNHLTVRHPGEKPVNLPVKPQQKVRSKCPHCNSSVANLGRHVREDCRMQPKNLVECPHCFAKVPRLRFKEHLNGRTNKATGVVTKKGCIEKQRERSAKEEKVAPVTRCEECGKNVTQKYLPEHKRLFHREFKLLVNDPDRKDSAGPGPETAPRAVETFPNLPNGVQSCLSTREKQPVKDQQSAKLNGVPKRPNIFYTREQWIHAVNEASYKLAQENSKKDAHLNQADMSRKGIQYMDQFGIRAVTPCRSSTGEPRFAPTDGDCLFSTVVILENPDLSDDETKEAATNLRISTVGEALHLFPNLSAEKKEQLRQACSGLASPDDERDVPLTDEEVAALLSTYMQNGEYGDNMGDVLCYLLASHLQATLLVINVAGMTAYFVDPNIFNHELSSKEIYVLVQGGEHYEGLILPRESKIQLEELYQTTFLHSKGQLTGTSRVNCQPNTSQSQVVFEAVSGESFCNLILSSL